VVCVLVGAIWAAYWPSLGVTTGSDQFDYLINTFGHYTTWDIFAHTYSYNRTRIVGPGDTMCFRPLFFAWLAWQQAWYEANLTAWQATGVWLHCAVCYLLFRLLNLAARSAGGNRAWSLAAAVVVTLFFALNPNVMVMVVWTHVNGYLVFLLFTLGALELLLRQALDFGSPRHRSILRLSSAWVLICAAAFTYELGQFLALLAGLFLLGLAIRQGRPRLGVVLLLAFALIDRIYHAANLLDQELHAGQYVADLNVSTIISKACSWSSLEHLRRLVLYSLVQPFFPDSLAGYASGRLQIEELAWSELSLRLWPVVGLCAITAWLALSLRAVRWHSSQIKRSLLAGVALAGGLLLLYLGIIVAGRMNIRPSAEILSGNSYYAYTPLLLASLLSAWLWIADSRRPASAAWRATRWTLLASLAVLALVGGNQVNYVSQVVADYDAGRKVIDQVQEFVQAHRHEPGFGLAFDANQTRFKGVPVLTGLFRRYENNVSPSHVLVVQQGKIDLQPFEEYLRQHTKTADPVFRDVVKVGGKYHVFHHAGKYQAVLYDEDRWEVASDASTLFEAEALAQETLRRKAVRQEMCD